MVHYPSVADLTFASYPEAYPVGSSSIEDSERDEILATLSTMLNRRNRLGELLLWVNMSPVLEIDLSSVYPCFEKANEPSSISVLVGREPLWEEMEQDLFVRMPPRRRYPLRIYVTGIRRAEPHVVMEEGLR